MAGINWPTSSRPGFKATENAGRLINCFAEPLGEGARAPLVRRRVPGLVNVAESNMFQCRALHAVGTTLLAAFTSKMAVVDLTTGVATSLGALAGDERITIATNNAASPDTVAVIDSGAVLNIFTGSTPTSFADADLPTVATSVCFQDGYFFFSFINGTIYASGLNAVTVDALHFTTYQDRPGGVTRLIPFRGNLFAMGPYAIGVYQNTGNATGFPYSFVDTIGKGLIAKFAVAGFENGWMDELLWVGDDSVVYHLQGYSPVPVSTPDVVRAIQAVDDKTELDAFVYMNGAHAIWSISGPTFTWEFNISTGFWHERKSHGLDRWRGHCSISFGGDWIVGATDTGDLYRLSDATYTEDGEPLTMEARSVPAASFPSRISVPRADFDFVVGYGEAEGTGVTTTDPQVSISWSDDGGTNWSTPLLKPLGGEGEFRTRISLLRTGLSGPQGRQWRVVVSDPVYCGLLGGAMAAVAREA
tara:strand:- start:308 stop:1729 length:1422 start_codon:yes stop_codon:yes gene_type:complete